MIQHSSPISGVAVWQDRYVVTAGYDNQVLLWDQRTKRPLARAYHDHLANQCAFSPDGTLLVTASSDFSARLWSVPDLRLRAVLADHDDDVQMAVFHPERELIATASFDYRVRVFDFSGALIQTFSGHTDQVNSVEWTSGGDELVSCSSDGTVRRWSLTTAGLVSELDLQGGQSDTVAIARDGTIFAGDDDGRIIVTDGDSPLVIQAHKAGVKRLALDEERGLLASLSYDRTMRLWDIRGDRPVEAECTELPTDVWARSCAFAGGTTIVLGTFGSTYRTYDYGAHRWETAEIPTTDGINAVLSVNGGTFTVGDAGVVRRNGTPLARIGSLCNFLTRTSGMVLTGGQLGVLYDAATGRRLHEHHSPLNCGVRFAHAGVEHVLIGSYTGEGLLFRVPEAGRIEHVRDVPLHTNAIKGVAVSGDLLLSLCADGSATWLDISALRTCGSVDRSHEQVANGCVGLGDGDFASVGRDRIMRLWTSDRKAEAIPTPHTHSIKAIAADSGGRLIATGGYNGMVAVYDRDGRQWSTQERPTTSGISALDYDAEAGVFLASSYDGRVYDISPLPVPRLTVAA
ncbi:WD40 repeat domain-containing protein [Streptomyces sp. MST-110588]|uniref:WD40 repeat domain-containing protein n=1 Tax=Streptomyces sp. MST-110588 TaxID=2833628 RepID=UPI001F5D934C|nr:WD40 repeat domain-containing protein [Streptomyces sp. MST-110588]UNO38721.1 WD40 repeat domain-containing protein [Streptomyces sp. MST-110588]